MKRFILLVTGSSGLLGYASQVVSREFNHDFGFTTSHDDDLELPETAERNDRAEICSISFVALAQSLEHRDRIARTLRENRIETRPLGGGNMSRQPYWVERYGTTMFPVADRIHDTGFQLPNHPFLSPEGINIICDTVLACGSAA